MPCTVQVRGGSIQECLALTRRMAGQSTNVLHYTSEGLDTYTAQARAGQSTNLLHSILHKRGVETWDGFIVDIQ